MGDYKLNKESCEIGYFDNNTTRTYARFQRASSATTLPTTRRRHPRMEAASRQSQVILLASFPTSILTTKTTQKHVCP